MRLTRCDRCGVDSDPTKPREGSNRHITVSLPERAVHLCYPCFKAFEVWLDTVVVGHVGDPMVPGCVEPVSTSETKEP